MQKVIQLCYRKYSELGRTSEHSARSNKDLLIRKTSKPGEKVTDNNAKYSEEKSKPTSQKRSSRSWKNLASKVTNSERIKKTSGSSKQKNEYGDESEGRSHTRDRGVEGEKTFSWVFVKLVNIVFHVKKKLT